MVDTMVDNCTYDRLENLAFTAVPTPSWIKAGQAVLIAEVGNITTNKNSQESQDKNVRESNLIQGTLTFDRLLCSLKHMIL